MIGGLGKTSRYLLAGASAIGILTSGVPEAAAQDLKSIQSQIDSLQATIKELQKQVGDAKAQAAAANAAAANAGVSDLDLKVKWRGAPEFSSADGKFKMKVRGRVQTDYSAIDQDQALTGRPDVNAAELRRARLGVEGVVWGDVFYIVEVDFANDAPALKDAYLEYTGLAKGLGLRAGNFKTPNGLEQMGSANYITFMERAAFVEAWGLDRQIGGGAIYAQDHFTLSAGIFGPTPFNDEKWLEDVKTGAARVTFAPINREVNGVHQVVHLGASWRGREGAEDLRSNPVPANDQFFSYRARGADLHLADRFVSTPAIFDQDTFWGLEALVIWKSFSVQGEYTQLEPELAPGFMGSDPTYNGWYVEANWFITGETQNYQKGVVGRPKVKNPVYQGGYGAWQFAGRYDVLDLADKATVIASCTMCGEQKTWLIGVNWWLNDHTRLQFNYNESDIEGGFLNGANVNDGAKIKGFGARAQVDW